ncbi:SidA/IucD/PvdA family monooxygenase [Streptomyces sp. NBC_01477]|uniref:SidA/IucD/PvdA family monooxygenase n=1 Tax=Streptomyces sp. NBC_01477 TaxID=2976015 RepID=UPI003FCD58DB
MLHMAGRHGLDGARDITVLGSGQSGAEIFFDLVCTGDGPAALAHQDPRDHPDGVTPGWA